MSVEDCLSAVFHAPSREVLAKTYDAWAANYDLDMLAVGYVHPAICVGLVSRYIQNKNAAIFDAGVGTGNIGQLLNIMGYGNLLGIDMSDGMLAMASARNVYKDLRNQILGDQLSFETASIDCIVSTGTFTLGHAPASAFDELARILKPGGYFIFTIGGTLWSEAGFEAKIKSLPFAETETTKPYNPMPSSKTESGFTAKTHVYRRT